MDNKDIIDPVEKDEAVAGVPPAPVADAEIVEAPTEASASSSASATPEVAPSAEEEEYATVEEVAALAAEQAAVVVADAAETATEAVYEAAVVQQVPAKGRNIYALRTALQALVGFLASGGILLIWDAYRETNTVDPTVLVMMGVVLSYMVSWAQNYVEEHGVHVPKIGRPDLNLNLDEFRK